MPKYILKRPWFAPTEFRRPDKIQVIGGQRFRKGEQDIPEELVEFLPSDAAPVDGGAPKAESKPDANPAHEADVERASGEAADAALESAEEKKRGRGRPPKNQE